MTKVHFKGSTDDFVVFVESPEDLKKWKEDQSIPLAQVVNSFKIMLTHKHGAQGQLDGASKSALENEFGTSNEDEVIKKILMDGQPQNVTVSVQRYTTPSPMILIYFHRIPNVEVTVTKLWAHDRDIPLHRAAPGNALRSSICTTAIPGDLVRAITRKVAS